MLSALIDQLRATPTSEKPWASAAPEIARAADVLPVSPGPAATLALDRDGRVVRVAWTAAEGLESVEYEDDLEVRAWVWQRAAREYPALADSVPAEDRAATGARCPWCSGRGPGQASTPTSPQVCALCAGMRWVPQAFLVA